MLRGIWLTGLKLCHSEKKSTRFVWCSLKPACRSTTITCMEGENILSRLRTWYLWLCFKPSVRGENISIHILTGSPALIRCEYSLQEIVPANTCQHLEADVPVLGSSPCLLFFFFFFRGILHKFEQGFRWSRKNEVEFDRSRICWMKVNE